VRLTLQQPTIRAALEKWGRDGFWGVKVKITILDQVYSGLRCVVAWCGWVGCGVGSGGRCMEGMGWVTPRLGEVRLGWVRLGWVGLGQV